MIGVVAGIIVCQGKILLVKAAESGARAGLWEFPGGKTEAGKSQQTALIRELCKEARIYAPPLCHIASHQREVNGQLIHLHARYIPGFTGEMRALQHQALIWCTPQQA